MKTRKIVLYKEINDKTTKGFRITITTSFSGVSTITDYIDFVNYGLRKVSQTKTAFDVETMIVSLIKTGYKVI